MDIILLFFLLLVFFICFYNLNSNRQHLQDPLLRKLKYDVCQLDPRINKIDFYSGTESYTEDKDKIYLCLKDVSGNYYDYNMLIYVAIHECSHALTDVIDVEHVTPEFRNMFDYLLQKAETMKIYDSKQPLTKAYCGVSLDIEKMQR